MPGVFLCCSACQAHRRAPLTGVLLCSSVPQAFDGPACLLFSCQCWHMGRESLWSWLHPTLTQQYHLASLAAGLSATGISHHSLLPHSPSICLSAVNSSPPPGIAPQSLNSSSQPLHLPGDQRFCQAYLWLQQGLSSSHSI